MLDISNNNSRSWLPLAYNFGKAYNAGQRRVYFKATEGRSFVDSRTPALAKRALKAKFKVGWYHFANSWDESPELQARHFVANVPKPYQLRLALDMEEGAPSAAKGEWARRFCEEVFKITGKNVLVYGSTYYLQTCFQGLPAPGPLWLAAVARGGGALDTKHAHIPPPWTQVNFAAHQFSWQGQVDGIPGRVDLSRPISVRQLDLYDLSR